MHELSIALSILDWAAEEAERHDGRIIGIHVRLGPLSGVTAQALESAFELAREGSPLADVRLVIEEIPIVGYCPTCGTSRQIASLQDLCCPECGTPTGDLQGGRDLQIVALEIQ